MRHARLVVASGGTKVDAAMSFLPAADLWTRLNRNYARLEETKYYPHNVYQRERQAGKWPGDTEGRTLLGWVLLAQATGRPPRYLDGMLARWAEEVNEKGYFGKIYTDGISEQQLSSHGWMLQALAELHRASEAGWRWAAPHDARALAMPIIEQLFLPTAGAYEDYPIDPAERETGGAYSGSHLKQVGRWILSTDVGCFAIGMTGLIDACEAFDLTDEFQSLIAPMADRFLAIDLKAIKAQTHATLTALRGLIRWSRMTDQPGLWTEVESRYQLYTDLAWTETYANYNWFDRPRWTEPCAMVDSLMVAMDLFQYTRNPIYLEHAQLTWFNALGHGQRANGGFGCDNCPGADGETELAFSTSESHWCCTMRGAEGLSRMCEYQVLEEEDGTLCLPFGLPGDWRRGSTHLQIESLYPHRAAWILTNRGATTLAIRLFLPSWVETTRDDPHWASCQLAPGETFHLEGNLTSTERPLLVSTTTFRPTTAGVVRMTGPLVLACYGEEDWKPICEDYLRGDMTKEHSVKTLITTT